jgi:hypothetical protein
MLFTKLYLIEFCCPRQIVGLGLAVSRAKRGRLAIADCDGFPPISKLNPSNSS